MLEKLAGSKSAEHSIRINREWRICFRFDNEITPYRLAKELLVSTSTVLDLIHGRRKLTTDRVLRLARLFGTSERFWINLQASIDVRNLKAELEPELKKIRPITATA